MRANEKKVQIRPRPAVSISDDERRARHLRTGANVRSTVGPGGEGAGGGRPRRVLPTRRSIFVRESDWHSGTGLRIPSAETAALLRGLRTRDVCLLLLLSQHHYLTTDQVEALLFPSPRSAQKRLRWLTDARRLLMSCRQLEPRNWGWRRLPSLFLLSERGAVVLARVLRTDARRLVKRSWYAAEYVLQLEHDLDVNAFFVGLAAASRELADQGLYHWVGQDSLRGE
jgi:protein involved in plasmid replication-relaxation